MKIKKIILSQLMFMVPVVFADAQQNDSIYSYSYECNNCGTFKTYSTTPIELTTQVNITSEVLPDTSISIFAQFTSITERKTGPGTSNIFNKSKNIFNVYPNPSKNAWFLYIESNDNCVAHIQLSDVYGRELMEENFNLKQGVNIFEKKTSDLATGYYYVKVKFHDEIFVRKILIEK